MPYFLFMLRLSFDKGTLLLKGEIGTPYGKWDPRISGYRIKALYYKDVIAYLKESKIAYEDHVQQLPPIETTKSTIKLRPYQKQAFNKWRKAQNKGIIVLPTAAGKTYLALEAIHLIERQTLIIVPTIDLIDQWRKKIKECLGVEAGAIGGGENNIRMITVATYDSAYLQAAVLGNKFMFLVFDEVHHLASPSYIQIAEMYIAPYRMGLTATFERIDERHRLLPMLVGDLLCTMEVGELTGKHLAPYTYEKLYVKLSPQEQQLYREEMATFRRYLRENRIRMRSPRDFQRFIMRTGRDPRAREALLARNRALKLAMNSKEKIKALGKQLEANINEKTLIFTLHTDLVYAVSRRLLIPAITYLTPKEERREILENFRKGKYNTIVTSQVLDEGIDVPDASVGYILSGTGSTRAYIQRLGRLLRKVEGKRARLVEIVSKETMEVGMSHRRTKKTEEKNTNATK
jgi:superfamily II DNA or RNA helicase